MIRVKWDNIVCIATFILLLIFAFQLPAIVPIARIYPLVLLIGAFIAVLILFVKTIRKTARENTQQMSNKVAMRIIAYLLIVLAYILCWESLGYIVTTFLFALVSLLFLGMKNKTVLVAFPIILTATIYLIFRYLLMVSLPVGTLLEKLLEFS